MTERIKEDPRKNLKRMGKAGATIASAALAFGGLNLISHSESTYAQDNAMPTPAAGEVKDWNTQTPSPEAVSKVENFEVKAFTTFDVIPGDVVSGDVQMSDTIDSNPFPMYDQDSHKAPDVQDNAKTALFIDVQAPGVVHSEWGATVTRGLTQDQKAEMLRLQKIAKENAGFERTDVVAWTGYNTSVDQAGYRADGTKGEALPYGSIETVVGTPNMSNPSEINAYVSENPNMDASTAMALYDKLIADGFDVNVPENQATIQALIDCICKAETSCPLPTETPKATPEPTKEPEVCEPKFKDHFLKAGQKITTPKGHMVIAQGDLEGAVNHDSLAETKGVYVFTDGKRRTFKAPWGADVMVFNDCATTSFVRDTYKDVLKQDNRKLDKNSVNQLRK